MPIPVAVVMVAVMASIIPVTPFLDINYRSLFNAYRLGVIHLLRRVIRRLRVIHLCRRGLVIIDPLDTPPAVFRADCRAGRSAQRAADDCPIAPTDRPADENA